MSMSINSAANAYAVRVAEQGARGAASVKEHSESKMPQIQSRSEPLSPKGADDMRLRRQQQLEKMADRLAAQIEAAATRREALATRWNERFVSFEENALNSGNDRLAKSIAEIRANVTKQLDNAPEAIVGQLEKVSKQIEGMLSTTYGAIGGEEARPNPGVDEVA